MNHTFESTSILEFVNGLRISAPAGRVPDAVDLIGYEHFVEFIRRNSLDQLPGDFLEIGGSQGAGTVKLAKIAGAAGKRVWVIDPFDPEFDRTREHIFRKAIARCVSAIQVLKSDSTKVRFPDGLRFTFAISAGIGNAARATGDFQMMWKRVAPGGWAAFHLSDGAEPETASAIDALIAARSNEIAGIEYWQDRRVYMIRKCPDQAGEGSNS